MKYVISFIIGYLIGSLPTAYIVLKKIHSLDITQTGSGNVGALNSFRVTKSKRIGLLVFAIDFLKGFISVMITILLFGPEFISPILTIAAAVLAHCYSPWLKFKGGKGLATAAGGGFIISIPILVIWGIAWNVFFFSKRDIDLANINASLSTMVFSFLGFSVIDKFSFMHSSGNINFGFLVSIVFAIIILKHISSYQKEINKKI
jgi:acyl phosphate:glycerol-3-phosphate acyltransferase